MKKLKDHISKLEPFIPNWDYEAEIKKDLILIHNYASFINSDIDNLDFNYIKEKISLIKKHTDNVFMLLNRKK